MYYTYVQPKTICLGKLFENLVLNKTTAMLYCHKKYRKWPYLRVSYTHTCCICVDAWFIYICTLGELLFRTSTIRPLFTIFIWRVCFARNMRVYACAFEHYHNKCFWKERYIYTLYIHVYV